MSIIKNARVFKDISVKANIGNQDEGKRAIRARPCAVLGIQMPQNPRQTSGESLMILGRSRLVPEELFKSYRHYAFLFAIFCSESAVSAHDLGESQAFEAWRACAVGLASQSHLVASPELHAHEILGSCSVPATNTLQTLIQKRGANKAWFAFGEMKRSVLEEILRTLKNH